MFFVVRHEKLSKPGSFGPRIVISSGGRPPIGCRINTFYVEWRVQAWRRKDLRQDFGRTADSIAIFLVGVDKSIPLRKYADVQSASIWQLKSETAGVRGGAREGRPRHSRIFVVVSGG